MKTILKINIIRFEKSNEKPMPNIPYVGIRKTEKVAAQAVDTSAEDEINPDFPSDIKIGTYKSANWLITIARRRSGTYCRALAYAESTKMPKHKLIKGNKII